MRRLMVAATRGAPASRRGMCTALLPRASSCAGTVVLANGRGGALGTAPLRVPAWQRSNFVDLAGQGYASPVRRADGLRAMAIARDMTEDEVTLSLRVCLAPPPPRQARHSLRRLLVCWFSPSLPPSSSLQYNNIANELLDDILEKLEVSPAHSGCSPVAGQATVARSARSFVCA